MDLRKQIYSQCFNPQKVQVLNPVTREMEMREVPCGKCYHCRITKVNEWCTRMVLESKARKYCYFITLTYSSRSNHTEVFRETMPAYHSSNMEHKQMWSPLVLRKDHLQKFFKRLRKNTNKRFKYFACGEYGGTYARPHYHMILWCDEPISKIDICRAWSTTDDYGRRVIIGNIDYNLIADNHLMNEKQMAAFKYVCKYLQKGSFDFDKLPTKQYHYRLLNSLYEDPTYFHERITCDLFHCYESARAYYVKRYSPFMLCSKSPAIGFDYLQSNLTRFKTGDFRLFGLSEKDKYILPTYFVRKTKESLCPYTRINAYTESLTSNAGIPDLVSMLVEVANCMDFIQAMPSVEPPMQYIPATNSLRYERTTNGARCHIVPIKAFTFYDKCNHEWYDFNGSIFLRYRKCRKGIQKISSLSVSDVLDRLSNTYKLLYDTLLQPMTMQRVQRERSLQEQVLAEYGSMDVWRSVKTIYQDNLLDKIRDKQVKYNQTKNKF